MNVVHDESLSTSNSDSRTFSKPVHTDVKICEILCVDDLPWEELHHRTLESNEPQSPMKNPNFKLNLGNISRTFPIDISIKPGIVENVHIGASCTEDEIQTYKALFQEFRDVFVWSYEEIPGIDPTIVVHEIKTYPNVKPVRQRFRQIHL